MTTKEAARKYYLNRMIKRFAKVKSRRRSITIPVLKSDSLTRKQSQYISEAIKNYKYTIQTTIE